MVGAIIALFALNVGEYVLWHPDVSVLFGSSLFMVLLWFVGFLRTRKHAFSGRIPTFWGRLGRTRSYSLIILIVAMGFLSAGGILWGLHSSTGVPLALAMMIFTVGIVDYIVLKNKYLL
jgi:hypothetical protein